MVCRTGSTESYRGKINLIGYTRAGKSSFLRRLLGKPFLENVESTEGIHTQLIITTYDITHQALGPWKEVQFNIADIALKFNQKVFDAKSNYGEAKFRGNPICNQKELAQESVVQRHPIDEFLASPELPADSGIGDTGATTDPGSQSSFNYLLSHQNEDTPDIKLDIDTLSQLDDFMRSYKSHNDTNQSIECQLRVWDHGGQLEFLTTHHLFLDVDAINLIVMDITKSLTEVIPNRFGDKAVPSVPRSSQQFLDYWLNSILVKAKLKKIDPSIAIILTHRDELKSSVEDYMSELLQYTRSKGYSDYLPRENIIAVDNKNEQQDEFNQIRMKIYQMVTSQASWGLHRPIRWLKLEAAIHEEAKKNKVKYLDLERVEKLATTFGIKKEETKSFLQFHHAMGDFVYFDEKKLRTLVIVDPQWMVEMFTALITPHDFLNKRNINQDMLMYFKKNAMLTDDLLHVLWKNNDVDFLKELMTNFSLLIPLEKPDSNNKKYLVPCMLPPSELNMDATEPFNSMRMLYSSYFTTNKNGFLFIGDFQRLLAKCSQVTSWKLCIYDHLSYTEASFKVQPGVRVAFAMFKDKRVEGIRTDVWFSKLALRKGAISLLPYVHQKIFEGFGLPFDLRNQRFLVACPYFMEEQEMGECMVRFNINQQGTSGLKDSVCPFHNNWVTEMKFAWFLHPSYPSMEVSLTADEHMPSLTSRLIGECMIHNAEHIKTYSAYTKDHTKVHYIHIIIITTTTIIKYI